MVRGAAAQGGAARAARAARVRSRLRACPHRCSAAASQPPNATRRGRQLWCRCHQQVPLRPMRSRPPQQSSCGQRPTYPSRTRELAYLQELPHADDQLVARPSSTPPLRVPSRARQLSDGAINLHSTPPPPRSRRWSTARRRQARRRMAGRRQQQLLVSKTISSHLPAPTSRMAS